MLRLADCLDLTVAGRGAATSNWRAGQPGGVAARTPPAADGRGAFGHGGGRGLQPRRQDPADRELRPHGPALGRGHGRTGRRTDPAARATSAPWPGAATAKSSPPGAGTTTGAKSGSGTRPPAAAFSTGRCPTRSRCAPWPSARTARTVLIGGIDGTAALWEVPHGAAPAGEAPATLEVRHQNQVQSVAFSPDGGTLLTGSHGQDGPAVGREDREGTPPKPPEGRRRRGLGGGLQPRREDGF